MEMAQLQHPLVLLSDLAHPRQIVDNQCPYTVPETRRDGRHGLLPARSTFLPRQQQWVEEGGVIASARLERGQVQDPRYCVELEPQAVGQQHERSRSEEHTSELQSLTNLVCRLLLEKKKDPAMRR